MNYIKNFLMLASVTLLLVITPWQVQAITISIFNVGTEGGQITDWINGLGGQKTVIEDFEDFGSSDIGWIKELDTNVGKFGLTENTQAGTGTSSYKYPSNATGEIYFELRENNANGRFNTTPTNGHKYLDSADITELQLTVEENKYKNLFFYMTDPSDVGARTESQGFAGSDSDTESVAFRQSNGSLWFVGIDAGDKYISKIVWSARDKNNDGYYTNDGFGLDGFSTVTPVPEPATMLLFGTGIVGLAFVSRRKRK